MERAIFFLFFFVFFFFFSSLCIFSFLEFFFFFILSTFFFFFFLLCSYFLFLNFFWTLYFQLFVILIIPRSKIIHIVPLPKSLFSLWRKYGKKFQLFISMNYQQITTPNKS